MNFYNKKRFLYTTVLALLICIGCSNKMPLTGKITFADDGEPLTTGTICFAAPEFLARGYLKEDGTYRVSSTGKNDGLPKGTYKVYFVGAELVSTDSGGSPSYTPLIDSKYDSADTTDIEFVVDGKTRRFDVTVERAKKR